MEGFFGWANSIRTLHLKCWSESLADELANKAVFVSQFQIAKLAEPNWGSCPVRSAVRSRQASRSQASGTLLAVRFVSWRRHQQLVRRRAKGLSDPAQDRNRQVALAELDL